MHGWEQKYKKFASKYINIIGHKYDRWGGGGGGGGRLLHDSTYCGTSDIGVALHYNLHVV